MKLFSVGFFYIRSLSGNLLKSTSEEKCDDNVDNCVVTTKTVLEKSKSCRWLDSGKYFQWEGEMLVNDLGELLTAQEGL